MFIYWRGTTRIMFCYQSDGPIKGKGGGEEGRGYNRDFTARAEALNNSFSTLGAIKYFFGQQA